MLEPLLVHSGQWVAKDVWIFSKPFARFGFIPVGGRSTAIKLPDGGVWVLASTPLNDETKKKINELGPVKYIIGPDAVHHLYLGEFKKEYPDAKLIAVEEAIKKKESEGLVFDGAWGKDPSDTKYGFEDAIQACYFSGYANKDVAFYHAQSKSLIQADLLFNLPPTEQYSTSKPPRTIPFIGNFTPESWIHKRFVSSMEVDKESMRRDAKTVANWDFERIIPCHGDVVEKDGNRAWRELYRKFLD